MPRRRAALVCLALLLVVPCGPAARSDDADLAQRKLDLLLKLKTRRAIDRGVLWLATQQRKGGSFRLEGNTQQGPFPMSRHRFGESALATLTLAHGGFGPDRPEIKKAVSYLRKHYRSYLKGDYWTQASSYALSIVVLTLHKLYAQTPDAALEEDRVRYGRSVRKRKNPCRYPAWAWQMTERILDWLLENRSAKGLFRYPDGFKGQGPVPPGGPGPVGGPPPGRAGGPMAPPGMMMPGPHHYGPEDLSNTQYVLLALWAGTRCGYEIEKEVLESIARRLAIWQESDGPEMQRVLDPAPDAKGANRRYADMTRPKDLRDRARGFGYTPGQEATGSMVAAGLSSLAIVKAILIETHGLDPALRKLLDRGIWDSIAWLARHFSVEGNPIARPGHSARPSAMWHYYYLYGLERACVIVDKKFLGENDWYRVGAELLVEAQRKDGAWRPPSAIGDWGGPGMGAAYDMAMHDTCFAILFLKRGVIRPKQPLLPGPTVTPPDEK